MIMHYCDSFLITNYLAHQGVIIEWSIYEISNIGMYLHYSSELPDVLFENLHIQQMASLLQYTVISFIGEGVACVSYFS